MVYMCSSYADYIYMVDLESGLCSSTTTLQNQVVYGAAEGEPMAMAWDPASGKIFLLFTSNGSFSRKKFFLK